MEGNMVNATNNSYGFIQYTDAPDIAMSIHLVSEKILCYLPFQELLNCSLVSRSWNFTCREYLRERKVCVASIRRPVTCKELENFSKLISTSVNIPFNGLSIELTRSWHTCVECNPLSIYQTISSRIPLRNIKFLWPKIINCPTEQFISYFQRYSYVLYCLPSVQYNYTQTHLDAWSQVVPVNINATGNVTTNNPLYMHGDFLQASGLHPVSLIVSETLNLMLQQSY